MKFKYAFVQKCCVAGQTSWGVRKSIDFKYFRHSVGYCPLLKCYFLLLNVLLLYYCNFLTNNIFIFLDSFNDLYTSYVIFCIFLMSVVIIVISIFNVEFYAGALCKLLNYL